MTGQNTPQNAPHAPVSDFQAPQAPGDATTAPDAAERAQRYADAIWGKAALDSDDLTAWVGEPMGWMVSSKAVRAALASVAPDTATPGETTVDLDEESEREATSNASTPPSYDDGWAYTADDKAGE